jgi:amino acid adenylation domain-containing protein
VTDAFIHESFARAAASNPTATAVACGGRSLTYAELDDVTGRWARVMLDRGIGPEDRIGICAPVSLDTICAVVAAVKTGAAFVPIDPSYPVERVRAIIEASQPELVLVHQSLGEWRPLLESKRMTLPALATAGAAASRASAPSLHLENAAYVVFTSGSTGRPKGVVVQHSGLLTMIEGQIAAFGVTRGSRVLQFASFSFDASVSEIFTTLCAGGTLCLIEHTSDRHGPAVLDLIERERISIVTLPPSLLKALPSRELSQLTTLVSAGEACSPEVVQRWHRANRRLINAYGPSEATVCATMNVMAVPDDASRLGGAIHGMRSYVLRDDLQPVAPGEVGELYLAGAAVARGYFGPRRLTAERFLPEPWGPPGSRMYRTGDSVRLGHDGALEFIGRTDHQLKIRGFRIEPAEVETSLRAATGVRDVLVASRRRASGDAVLVAYVLGGRELEQALRVHARRALADFMQPSEYVFVDEWPRTPAGKVDRDALTAIGRSSASVGAPTSELDGTEAALVGIFENLLELHGIDRHASFFDLGGDSILALRLLLQIEARLHVRVGFAALFEMPSATALAAWIDRRPDTTTPYRGLVLRTGTRSPLWLVPPTTGNPLCYLEFARRLRPGVPLYSVQIPGLEDDREPLDDLIALARVLVEQIRTRQPRGPYRIGGWSFGGSVAFEAALQLEAQGEQIARLVLISSTPPSQDHVTAARQIMAGYPFWKMCFMYASLMAHSSGQQIDLKIEYESFRDLDDAAAYTLLADRLVWIGTVPAGTSAHEIHRWVRVFRSSLMGFHAYDAHAKLRGRALVVSATQSNPVQQSPMVDRPLPPGDWAHHLERPERIQVEGFPLSLMARPWVDGVVEAIENWLDG